MKSLSKSDIQKVQRYFASQKDVVGVYLYGSFTKRTTHPGSDIDFGVLFDSPIKTYYRLGKIINDLSALGLPAEPEVREIDLRKPPLYLRNVINGRLIFSRDEIKRVRFEVSVMQLFRDTEQLRDINDLYMKKRLKEGTYGFRLPYTI